MTALRDEAIKLFEAQVEESFQDEPQQCWETCQKLLKLDPQNHAGHYYGAHALFYMGRFQDARNLFLKAPEATRNDPCAIWSLACTEVALGLAESALKNALLAIQRDPSLQERVLQDKDLEPIWARIKRALNGGANEEKGTSGSLEEALARLKAVPPPAHDDSVSCYMPGRRPKKEGNDITAGGTLTFLCPFCSLRTNYHIGSWQPVREPIRLFGPKIPPVVPPPTITIENAKLLIELVFPNRRALAGLPPEFQVDETDFCKSCATPTELPHIKLGYKCKSCGKLSVYHLGQNTRPPQLSQSVLHSGLDHWCFKSAFLEAAKLQARLPGLGTRFQLLTRGFCMGCTQSTVPFAALELKDGEKIRTVKVTSSDIPLLKKFMDSLELADGEKPNWQSWEAERLAKMFAQGQTHEQPTT